MAFLSNVETPVPSRACGDKTPQVELEIAVVRNTL